MGHPSALYGITTPTTARRRGCRKDVYKRHIPYRAALGKQLAVDAVNRAAQRGQRRILPVSYTHLDVYKRQADDRQHTQNITDGVVKQHP